MAVIKTIDSRTMTHGGGEIRVEVWQDSLSRACVRYNFAYVNGAIVALDNGRVVGFDDAHFYPGFSSKHHCHWMGNVYENKKPFDIATIDERFNRFLRRLRQIHKRRF